jgi:hypothetical protein
MYWRKNDIPRYRDAIVKLCQLHLKAQDVDAALADYDEYKNFDRALAEYENLAAAHPAERQSLLALMAAGRLAFKKLNRPSDALRYYKAAEASPVPHLDWQPNIETGIREAEKVLGPSYAPVTKG